MATPDDQASTSSGYDLGLAVHAVHASIKTHHNSPTIPAGFPAASQPDIVRANQKVRHNICFAVVGRHSSMVIHLGCALRGAVYRAVPRYGTPHTGRTQGGALCSVRVGAHSTVDATSTPTSGRETQALAQLLYHAMTTGCGQQTLGEEYCDLIQGTYTQKDNANNIYICHTTLSRGCQRRSTCPITPRHAGCAAGCCALPAAAAGSGR